MGNADRRMVVHATRAEITFRETYCSPTFPYFHPTPLWETAKDLSFGKVDWLAEQVATLVCHPVAYTTAAGKWISVDVVGLRTYHPILK